MAYFPYPSNSYTYWRRTKPGYIKVNTDASIQSSWAGIGWVMRNDVGKWIASGHLILGTQKDIRRAEMEAIRYALKHLKELPGCYRKCIEVETDNKDAFGLINKILSGGKESKNYADVTSETVKLMRELEIDSIEWIN